MKWYKWALSSHSKDGEKIIRRYRYQDGKRVWETYDKSKYKDMSEDDVTALLRRLNVSIEAAELEAKKRYDYDHAYINALVLKDFETYLKGRASSKEHINTLMNNLHEYTFKYFIHAIKNPDPSQWKKHEGGFGHFLLTKGISPAYLVKIIQTTNRFIKFLHDKYPDEVRLTKLDPISPQVLKSQKPSKNHSRKKFIINEDFEKICAGVKLKEEKPKDPAAPRFFEFPDKRIIPMIKLGYYFGLRRAEVLGLKIDDVFEDALNVERQLVSIGGVQPDYEQLKGKEARLVPYWGTTPDDTYKLISELELIHPDSLSDMFDEAMKALNMLFQFHDLRRTWITRFLREKHYLDVRLAAGHKDLKTTQGYIQDDRQLQRKKFVPKTG